MATAGCAFPFIYDCVYVCGFCKCIGWCGCYMSVLSFKRVGVILCGICIIELCESRCKCVFTDV